MTTPELISAFKTSSEVPSSTLALRFPGVKEDAVILVAMRAALPEFSRDVPLRAIYSGTYDGTDIELAGWHMKSRVIEVQHPDGIVPPARLPKWHYSVSEDGVLSLLSGISGATIRVRYTRMHAIPGRAEGDADPGTDPGADPEPADIVTIPPEYQPAFFKLTASVLLARIAVAHGETQQTDINADLVAHQTKSGEYTRLAKEAYAAYCRMLGRDVVQAARPSMSFGTVPQQSDRILPILSPNPVQR